ncbi:actin family [Polychytrium aggregatum]|uniref:actin family n=1 Tax=Polychytrium aggregatum TaxID=110093 RepID=UPI0022FE7F1A|nr:actin family [Polychytrium aggregatum]KAI9208297.1 actin family [Polychytrium aggregatum]
MQNFYAKEKNFLVVEPGSWRSKAGTADYLEQYPCHIHSRIGVKYVPVHTESAPSEDPSMDSPSHVSDTVKAVYQPLDSESDPPIDQSVPTDPEALRAVRPIQGGLVADWGAFEALLDDILIRQLAVNRAKNESLVVLSLPVRWNKFEHERLAQIMFESLNCPGILVVEQPLMALYGANLSTGLVIDIGHETTDITPVIDNVVVRHASITLDLGGSDIDQYLLSLLREDPQVAQDYGHAPDLKLARAIKESKFCDIRPATIAKVDTETERKPFTFDGKTINLGLNRHLCANVLFDPLLVGKSIPNLCEGIQLAISAINDLDKRFALWESLLITGGSSNLIGLKDRLESEIAPYISASETANEYQPKEIKFLRLSEYFVNFKDQPHDAAFIGASLVAKLMFPESKNYVSKVDYNELGPACVHLKA